jgi:iron complex transport system permease protein
LAEPIVGIRAGRGLGRLSIGLTTLAAAMLFGVTTGPAGLDPIAVLASLVDVLPGVDTGRGLEGVGATILWEIRLPRVVLGAIVGATLAVAGASYQGVFRNPLADPYLLGVAAGAGLGATLAFSLGLDRPWVAPLAFVGGLVAVGITYLLGRSVGGRTTTSLILAGVAVAAFATAVQTFLLQRRVEVLREVYSWILGRLTTVGWAEVGTLVPYALVAGALILASGRLLDVLRLGDEEAASLGVRVDRVRAVVVVAATLATAAAVSVSGLIGFVGIIVPHTLRLLFGWSYRVILPLSAMFGAAFLVAADIAARSLISPAELPIGVVTAFFGAPFFVLVLRTAGRSR